MVAIRSHPLMGHNFSTTPSYGAFGLFLVALLSMEFMAKDVNNTYTGELNSPPSDTSSSVTENPPGAQTWRGKNDRNIFYTLWGELAQLDGSTLMKMSTAPWLHVQGNNPPKRKTILLEPSTYIHYESAPFPKTLRGKVTWTSTSLLNAMTSNIWMFPCSGTRLGHVLAQTLSHSPLDPLLFVTIFSFCCVRAIWKNPSLSAPAFSLPQGSLSDSTR